MNGNNENCCRMCGNVTTSGVSLLDPEYRTLAQFIVSNFRYEVEEGGVYPTTICLQCVDNLNSFHKYTQNCEHAQNKFTNKSKESTSSVNLPDFVDPNSVKNEVTHDRLGVKFEGDDPLENIKVEVNESTCNRGSSTSSESTFGTPSESHTFGLWNCVGISTHIGTLCCKQDTVENCSVNERDKFNDPVLSASELKIASQFPQLKVVRVNITRLETQRDNNQTDGRSDITSPDKNPSKLPNQCLFCVKKFKARYNYKQHLINIHKISKEQILKIPALQTQLKNFTTLVFYTCDICDKSFNHKYNLVIHKLAHYGKRRKFQCPHCEKNYLRNDTLNIHIETKHVKSNKIFPCQFCPSKFTHKSYLKHHVLYVHSENKYKCKFCNHISRNKRYLRLHIAGVHGSKKYICNFCGHNSSLKCSLANHILLSHVITSKDIKCEKCDAEFKTKAQLRSHVKILHSNFEVPILHCDICKANFKHPLNLHQHKKNVHEGGEYSCTRCHAIYTTKTGLRRHQLLNHIGDIRSFQCQECDRKFFSKANVNTHVKTVHRKELIKLSYCDQCNKSFNSNLYLNKHKIRSHPKKKVVCQFCNKKLKNIFTLKKHIATFHTK